jgi:peptidoglycan/LPS O-acetylase OafA/YrhL
MHSNPRVEFANSLRGLAAVAVVFSHYFGVFWKHPEAVANLINSPALIHGQQDIPALVRWLDFTPIFNWGVYGVALFFLISGFVIPFSLTGTNGGAFGISRCLRIVPTYVVGFSMSLLALWICAAYFSVPWPYHRAEIFIHYLPGLRDLLSSRLIDGIIWTLEIEIKFYILCGLSIVWFRRGSLKVFLIPVTLFAFAALLNHAGIDRLTAFPSAYRLALALIFCLQFIVFMFVGVLFHYLYKDQISARNAALSAIGLFGLFCLQWRTGPNSASFGIAASYVFALATFVFAYAYPRFFRGNSVFNFLADVSYPLYVIHGVAGYAALRLLLDQGFKAWTALMLVTIVCLIVAWLLHRLIERPSQALGKRLARRLEMRPPMTIAWPGRNRAVVDSTAL